MALTAARASAFDPARLKVMIDRLQTKTDNPKDDVVPKTSAALALGATDDDAAIAPLCNIGLNDETEGSAVVRQSSALALRKLNRPAALSCLKARLSVEKDDSVKVQINRAIESIGGGGGGGSDEPIKENPNAKYYIALSSVSNGTSRGQSEVEGVVLRGVRSKLDEAGTMQLAPRSEEPDAARAKIKARKLNAFYLSIAVDKFDYTSVPGQLVMKVKIGVFTYPGKSLIGNADKTLRKEVSGPDKAAEDQMLSAAAEAAGKQFAENASQFVQ
jgi:hypothetical protein